MQRSLKIIAILTGIIAAFVIVVALLIASGVRTGTSIDHFFGLVDHEHYSNEEFARIYAAEQEMIDKIHAGDEDAAAHLQSILDNQEQYSAREVSSARYNSTYLYAESADQEDAFRSIRELKANFLDTSLSIEDRVKNLNVLVTVYCGFARDEETIREVFKGEPFEQMWIEGDVHESIKNLAMLSYNMLPTARMAMTMAHDSIGNLIVFPNMPEDDRRLYIELTKKYLNEADLLTQQEIERAPERYLSSRKYIANLYWRAMTVTILDEIVGDPDYAGQGSAAYDTFFEEIARQENTFADQYIPYAYVMRAYFIYLRDGDKTAIENYLQNAVNFIENDTRKLSEFTEFILDSRDHETGGPVLTAIRTMADHSESFGSFIENILASN
jgi:hypothetical protein